MQLRRLATRIGWSGGDALPRESSAPGADTAGAFSFEARQGLQGLEGLAAEWRTLLASIAEVQFNHFPEWYRAYLESGECDPAHVWFIAAYRNEQLAAICPLQFQSHHIRLLRPRFLGTVGGDELQLSDFVCARSTDNGLLLWELTRWLRAQRTLRWDILRLAKVSEDSSLGSVAKARLPGLGLAVHYDDSAFFDTRGSYEQATCAMASKMRSNLRRRARLAESSAPLRLESCRQLEDVQRAFDIFLDIESSGWKGPTGTRTAIRCVSSALAFYTHLVREFTARNACVIQLLWHGDHAIAGQLGLHLGRTLYVLKVGYRDDNPILAPGILLQDRTIRHACGRADIDVLSMVNNPHWLHSFKPNTVKVWLYCAPNRTVRGVLALAGMWLKRQWLAHARKPQTPGSRRD